MAFSREGIFFKWDYTGPTPAYERAFLVVRASYLGGSQAKPASYERSLLDNSLLAVRASTKPRTPSFVVLGEDSTTGTLNDGSANIAKGTIAHLKLAWAATDLKALLFEDSSYWDAEIMGAWPPMLEYDPLRKYALIPLRMEEK